MATIVTDQTFADETKDGVVLVDFYADWCGPCQMLMPTIDEISEEHAGKVKVVKVNVDDSSETAQKFGVMSIPTLKFLKDGEEVGSLMGNQDKEAIVAELEKAMA